MNKSVSAVHQLLLAEVAFYFQLWFLHWNITGEKFHETHLFLDGLRKDSENIVDTLAERLRALKYPAPSSLKEVVDGPLSVHDCGVTDTASALSYVKGSVITLVGAYTNAVSALDTEDRVTSNILQDICQKRQKLEWFLEMMCSCHTPVKGEAVVLVVDEEKSPEAKPEEVPSFDDKPKTSE